MLSVVGKTTGSELGSAVGMDVGWDVGRGVERIVRTAMDSSVVDIALLLSATLTETVPTDKFNAPAAERKLEMKVPFKAADTSPNTVTTSVRAKLDPADALPVDENPKFSNVNSKLKCTEMLPDSNTRRRRV